ncbi:unnamed protein product [Rhizophagus irregularis]|nr:unnamed protein product [Rhizophagus irregularis]
MSENMSTSKNYPGQDGKSFIISYLKERGIKSSYYGFLSANHDIIINSILSTDKCENLNTIWFHHFLTEAKSQLGWKIFVEVKNKHSGKMFLRNMKKKITTLQVKQKEELKRARDDADVENLSTEYWKKQS